MRAVAIPLLALLLFAPANADAATGRPGRDIENSACMLARLPPTPGVLFQDIASRSATDAMAVGSVGAASTRTYAIHWNGAIWSVVSTPNHVHYASNWIDAVAPIPGTDQYWAVGVSATYGNDATLILRWNGSAWVFGGPLMPGVWLNSVTALSFHDAWAVGYLTNDGNGLPVALHWDGARWTRVHVPRAPTGPGALYGVAARSPNDVWAVGTGGTGGLIERWNGSFWSVIASPNSGYLWSIAVLPDAHEVWATGANFDEWNGRVWSVQPGDPGSLGSIVAITADDIWAAGDHSLYPTGRPKPLLRRWDGTRWFTIPAKNPNPRSSTSLFGLARTFVGDGVWVAGTTRPAQHSDFIEACS